MGTENFARLKRTVTNNYKRLCCTIEKLFASQATGTNIDFTENKIFNTFDTPGTGDITNDLTDAKLGIVQKIYHEDGVAPSFPAGWVLLGSGTYDITKLNIIYAEWVSGTRVEYWIVQEA